jgi:hypothetical protein
VFYHLLRRYKQQPQTSSLLPWKRSCACPSRAEQAAVSAFPGSQGSAQLSNSIDKLKATAACLFYLVKNDTLPTMGICNEGAFVYVGGLLLLSPWT